MTGSQTTQGLNIESKTSNRPEYRQNKLTIVRELSGLTPVGHTVYPPAPRMEAICQTRLIVL
ncbi:hypothetical protein EMIT0P253_160040 [Pseudomonas sp. IT-P253]